MAARQADYYVFYPRSTRVLVVVTVPTMIVLGAWLALQPLVANDLTTGQQWLLPVFGIFMVYTGWNNAQCFPYLNSVISLFDDGIAVLHKDKLTECAWNELEVIEYSVSRTTRIAKKDGSTIVHLSDGLPNLALMVNLIRQEDD